MTVIPILQIRRLRVWAVVTEWRREADPPVTTLPAEEDQSCLDYLLVRL